MPAATYRFGPFVVDGASYRILRDNRPLDVTPKLLDLLIYLLEHHGTLVTKEALLDALWPDANVTENALAQAVSELRQALGDDAGAPTFIKTVARRGYRFIAPVEKVAAPVETSVPAPTPGESGATLAIAVTDFSNVTGEPEYAWLSAGIAETVTSDLRALDRFRVLDRWRVLEATRRTSGSMHDIAADLQAQLVVAGSYQRHGDELRITARVLNVASGEAVGDAKVDGPLADIFSLQDQVVVLLARDMGMTVEAPTAARLAVRETSSLEAFRAYSEGLLRLESLDMREMPQATADFAHAVEADPRYALAYTGLASAEYALYETTRSDTKPDHALLERAIQHARQAVSLDEGAAEAHATLALVLVSAGKQSEAAGAARRAVALEPTNWRHFFRLGHATWGEARLQAAAATLGLYPDFAFAHFQIAMVHVARGQLSQAETVLREGADVQDRQIGKRERYPALGLHWLLGLVHLAQGRHGEAVDEFRREQELAQPHRLYGREFAVHSLFGEGMSLLAGARHDEAIRRFEKALDMVPDHPQSRLGLACVYRSIKKEGEARSAFARVGEIGAVLADARPVESALVEAESLAAAGQLDRAVGTLARLVADLPQGFSAWTIPVDPFLTQLVGRKDFTEVTDRLKERAR